MFGLILFFLSKNNFSGSINVAAKLPFSMREIVEHIEKVVNKKASVINQSAELNSPYGIDKNWYVNTEKIINLGFEPKPILDWIEQ